MFGLAIEMRRTLGGAWTSQLRFSVAVELSSFGVMDNWILGVEGAGVHNGVDIGFAAEDD